GCCMAHRSYAVEPATLSPGLYRKKVFVSTRPQSGTGIPNLTFGCCNRENRAIDKSTWGSPMALFLASIMKELGATFAALPDHRQGKNVSYAIRDAAAGAFSVFFMQSPS